MNKSLNVVLACLLLLGLISVASNVDEAAAATSSTPQAALPAGVVKPVFINKLVSINVVDVNLAPTDSGKTVSYTLSLYNGSTKSINLLDYWFRLGSSAGESFTLKLTASDSKKKTIAPKTTSYLNLYADVGSSSRLSDLILKVVRFDFSQSNYEAIVGSFKFPAGFTAEVKPGSYKKMYLGNTVINSKISQSLINSTDESHHLEVTLSYNNVGKQTVKLSKYKYVLVTSEGYMYNMTSAEVGDVELSPWNRKELLVTVDVPATVKSKSWKIIALEDAGEEGKSIPVGIYQVLLKTGSATTATDNFTYSNTQGKYKFVLNSVTRQPWEDGDVLSANIRIENQGTEPLSIPTIEGYFYFDNKVKVNFKRVISSSVVAIQPGSSVRFNAYVKLASNYQFSTAKVVLNEKKEQSAVKAGELQSSSFLTQLPVLSETSFYDIKRDGSTSKASINRVAVYEGQTTKTYTVQVAIENMEKRTISPVKLSGYFINENQEIFPATAVVGEGKVTPGSKSLVRFEAIFPKQASTANLKLIVGEAVNDQSYAEGNANADAYVNAVAYALPTDIPAKTNLKDVLLLPHTLTIDKFTPLLTNEEVIVRMHYKLDKDMNISIYPEDRKLQAAIEYFDNSKQEWVTMFQQDLNVEKAATPSLSVGEHDLEIKQPTTYDTINYDYNYRFRIYEVVGSNKKMLADRGFTWYIENK
ncbi:hypothetical protein ACFPPD_13080 [Cohnella suwonensis]|uniref:Uncharacterized protein n=1 Tax=Cohnella suwonensis TaxID=696072 RepID=A0ABW0LWE0_9BACL